MPLTSEQERIKRLFEGDPLANRQMPTDAAPALGPQDYQRPESSPPTPQMQYSSNKAYSAQGSSQYYDAIQNRFSQIAGIGAQATERSLAAAQQKAAADYAARQAAANSASNNVSYDGSGMGLTGNKERDFLIKTLAAQKGVPYAWGGGSLTGVSRGVKGKTRDGSGVIGFDCSGLVRYAYAQIGIKLPRTSAQQLRSGVRIPMSQAQPGDLVGAPGHVAVYAGNGMMWETGGGGSVRYRPVWKNMFAVKIKGVG